MSKEKTCGNCIHLQHGDMCGLKTAFCGFDSKDDGPIVPHHAELENGKRGDDTLFTFWRIPTWCKRDCNEVEKSDEQALNHEWVIKTV